MHIILGSVFHHGISLLFGFEQLHCFHLHGFGQGIYFSHIFPHSTHVLPPSFGLPLLGHYAGLPNCPGWVRTGTSQNILPARFLIDLCFFFGMNPLVSPNTSVCPLVFKDALIPHWLHTFPLLAPHPPHMHSGLPFTLYPFTSFHGLSCLSTMHSMLPTHKPPNLTMGTWDTFGQGFFAPSFIQLAICIGFLSTWIATVHLVIFWIFLKRPLHASPLNAVTNWTAPVTSSLPCP